MTGASRTSAFADLLIAAWDRASEIAPFTSEDPTFDVAAGYAVMREIERRRMVQGWRPLGRKIGFTNRTIWARYGVYLPMWAHVWDRTVHDAPHGRATLSLSRFVQPRIEPEVVFGLSGPISAAADAPRVMESIEWIAPGFEIVQSHFPNWKFEAPDCTAAFGLHGALVVGTPVPLTERNRAAIAAALATFTLTLRRGRTVVDRGLGANVLGSPALALVHLVRVLATQPQFPPLGGGEIVTTGTVTDAWPVTAGETWAADYGALGLDGATLTFS